MKLIKLKIENIASIEKAEIDFDCGPLADTSVFLITGDTGAGKSTILDSVCLTLYNTTPRLNMASGVKSNFGTDNITAKNTSNLLRHGARQASAVLTFVGSDGVRYEAAWQVKRNRNNRLTSPEQTLSWGEVTVRNADAVKKITEEAVGLDFEQFCRTTMLAQGQFTQFLKSKDDDKSEILEKLTGTGIYSEIGRKIEEIKKEKEAEYCAQKSLTEGIVLLKQEETDLLNEQRSMALARKKQLENEVSHLETCMKWKENLDRIQHEKFLAAEAVNVSVEIMKSDTFKEETKLISDIDRIGTVGNTLQMKKEAERKISELELGAEKLKSQFEELRKGKNGLEKWIDDKKNSLAVLNGKISAAAGNASMFANVQKIETLLNSALDSSVRVRKNSAIIKKLSDDMPAIEKACCEKEKNVGRLESLVKQKEEEIGKVSQSVEEMKPEEVNAKISSLNIEKDNIGVLNVRINELKDCVRTQARLEKEIQLLYTECKQRETELEKANARHEEVNRKYIDAKKAYDGVELSLREWTVSVRSKLAIGDVCPVCGQIIDKLVTDEECCERLRPLEIMVASAEKELRDTVATCNATGMMVERLKNDIRKKEKEKNDAESEIKDLSDRVRKACEAMSVASNDTEKIDIPALEETVRSILASNSAKMETLLEVQKRINEGNKHLSELNNALRILRKEMDDAVRIRDKAKETRLTAIKEMERVGSLVESDKDGVMKSLKDAGDMISIAGWKEMWENDALGLIAFIRNSAAEYEGWEKEVLSTEKILSQAIPALENVEKIITDISKQWKEWAADSVEECLLIDKLTDRCIDFANRVQALATSLSSERERVTKLSGELDDFLVLNPDLDCNRIEYVSSIKNISEIRDTHNRKITQAKTAENVLAAKQKELDSHLFSRPENLQEGIETDALKSFLAEKRAAIDGVMSDMGRIEQQLKSNEENIARFSAEKEKEESKRRIFVEWDTLNKLFGGGDGKIFRRIAQSFILSDLLHRANGYLIKLNKRYRLDCEPGTLTIRMMDMYQNDAQGPVDILSGGEGFLVSLSLALALSSLNRRNLSVDTLFIDEGFGTLSGEVLNTVMNMLEKLQCINGKRVGIISHVEGLKERIPVQVKVKRIDQTRSMVEVVDGRL